MANHSYLLTITLETAVFFGLAVYVITRNPRRTISWVFGAFCLSIGSYYLLGLFLFPPPGPHLTETPLALRLKWAISSFAPAFYLHLTSFYFPPTWRSKRAWLLFCAYGVNLFVSLFALFSNLIIAGPLYRSPGEIIGPVPGTLMLPFLVFMLATTVVGTVGLVLNFQTSPSSSVRRQILLMLSPTVLLIFSAAINWFLIFSRASLPGSSFYGDLMFALAGFLYASAVLRYGSFVGQTLAWRDLFYSLLSVLIGVAALLIGLYVDQRLFSSISSPFPILTILIVVLGATGFPAIRRGLFSLFDPWLFRSDQQQLPYRIEQWEPLLPNPSGMQSELLGTLQKSLGVRGAYIARANLASPDKLSVSFVVGEMAVHPGAEISYPLANGDQPKLVSALPASQLEEPGWQQVAAFCPVDAGEDRKGLLALGAKEGVKPFTPADLLLFQRFARQIEMVMQIDRLLDERKQSLKTIQQQEKTLQQMEAEVMAVALGGIAPHPQARAPLEIYILGMLEVWVNGEIVPENAWGSERARHLLAYLLWKGRDGASREEITLNLWPEHPDDKTANVFHVTMNRLRKVLEPQLAQPRHSQYLRYENGKYRFNLQAPHWLDLTAFTSLAQQNDLESLREAATLYRGEYLQDVAWYLPPEVEVQRRALEQVYQKVLSRLIPSVNDQEAEIYLKKYLLLEPGNEKAQADLVRLYLKKGRQDLAREQVLRWKKFQQEWGSIPTSEARLLWEEVLGRSPAA